MVFGFWVSGLGFGFGGFELLGFGLWVVGLGFGQANHLGDHGGTSWSVPGEPAARATPTDIYSEL